MSFNGTIEVSCSDSDFYQRKIQRLEDDISILHEQLTKTRSKLRIAQDFQIKYHILLKNSEAQILQIREGQEADRQQTISRRLQQLIKQKEQDWLKKQQQAEEAIKRQANIEIASLTDQNKELSLKVSQLNTKIGSSEFLGIRIRKLEKEKENLEQMMAQQKEEHQLKKQQEVESLRVHLNTNFREKIANERKNSEMKISALEKQLIQKDIQKDEELFKLPSSSNAELAALKQLIEQKASRHSKEAKSLDDLLRLKNQEIKEALEEQGRRDKKYQEEIKEKERIINQLEATILEKEEEHQKEVTLILNKSSEMRNQQITEMTTQIEDLRQENTKQKEWWSHKLINHDQEVNNLTRKHEADIQKLHEDNNELKGKIHQLLNRLKQYEGEKAVEEEEELLASYKDLQQKKSHITNYEDGVTFLQGQLAKCQRKLQQKAREVLSVNKEISQIRVEMAQQSAQMYSKLLTVKQQHNEKVAFLQKTIEELNQQLRKNEKQVKKMKREQMTFVSESQLERKKLKYALQQIRRDYDRVVESRKSGSNSIQETQKNKADNREEMDNTKKTKWLELERQKNRFETIFREKQEQLKVKYEGELAQKEREIIQMKRKVELGTKDLQLMETQNNKLKEELGMDKENCGIRRYHNKLASLNLELAVAKNVYDAIIKTKFKINPPQSSPQPSIYREDVPIKTESQDPLAMSFDPSIHDRI